MVKIDYRDARPIYEQVADGIEELALRGALPADTQLPSVRQFAMELSINPNTIQRAYHELESEGFIYTLPGKGCFVAERSTELLREENLKKIEGHMQEVRRLASACRLTENELDEMWRLQKEEAE